jgi:hypothetical protein
VLHTYFLWKKTVHQAWHQACLMRRVSLLVLLPLLVRVCLNRRLQRNIANHEHANTQRHSQHVLELLFLSVTMTAAVASNSTQCGSADPQHKTHHEAF